MSGFLEKMKLYDDFAMLGGALESDIKKAERTLGLAFAKEYRDYLSQYGVGTAGAHEFTGIAKSKRLSVVSVTKTEKEKNPNIPMELYVIEKLGIDGIIIWQSCSGAIYQTVLKDAPKKLCNSLSEYIDL